MDREGGRRKPALGEKRHPGDHDPSLAGGKQGLGSVEIQLI